MNKYLIVGSLFLMFGMLSCSVSHKKEADDRVNHLLGSSSPYLIQHLYNPVDWYPWGNEALEKAKEEGKLLVISIGFSACHWCHVMERESFSDSTVASVMNDNFVSIKVDREERADIDKIYADAAQVMTGNVGWPLNIIALPDGRPVFAGTYFSKSDWIWILSQATEKYKENPERLDHLAQQVVDGISQEEFELDGFSDVMITESEHEEMIEKWLSLIDFNNGGLKGPQKFPRPANPEFLMAYYFHTKDQRALKAVDIWLKKMINLGLYDHLGGGFFRYTTDSTWRVPHFEKMLYDNAQLICLYSKAYQISNDANYKKVVYQTIDFVETKLTTEDWAFYTSVNAEAEGTEGKYYTWTLEQVEKILEEDAPVFCHYFGITDQGNLEEGQNILQKQIDSNLTLKKFDLDPQQMNKMIASASARLMQSRDRRKQPTIDDKVITAWNAQMISAYTTAYRSFGEARFLKAALRSASYLHKNATKKDGRVLRDCKEGTRETQGFLDDYAFLIKAYIDLYEVTFDEKWIKLATELTEYTIAHFYDNTSGLFYYTSDTQETVLVRKRETQDGPTPSSNSQMAINLHDLGTILNREDYADKAKKMIATVKAQIVGYGAFYSNWAMLNLDLLFPYYEVMIVGAQSDVYRKEISKNFIPHVILVGGEKDGEVIVGLDDKKVEGETMIYACQNKFCKRPVNAVEEALSQILTSVDLKEPRRTFELKSTLQ